MRLARIDVQAITRQVVCQSKASYRPPPSGGPAIDPTAKKMLCSAAALSERLLFSIALLLYGSPTVWMKDYVMSSFLLVLKDAIEGL